MLFALTFISFSIFYQIKYTLRDTNDNQISTLYELKIAQMADAQDFTYARDLRNSCNQMYSDDIERVSVFQSNTIFLLYILTPLSFILVYKCFM